MYNPTVNNVEEQATSSFVSKLFVYLSFLLIIPFFLYMGKRNSLVRKKEKIEETASAIDVQLKKRVDMLTKLVDATKQYMKYENSTLTDIVALRNKTNSPLAVNEFGRVNSEINTNLGRIFALMENYPNLKANENVLKLQNAIEDCENNISAARRFYNTAAREFNVALKTWPGNVAASSMKLHTCFYFEASEADRKDISIDLGQW